MFPEGFENRMKQMLGPEWNAFASAHHEAPPVSIRLNRKKSVDISLPPVPWCETGRYLPVRPVFTRDPTFHAGAFYVQEASSMFLEQVFKQHISKDVPLTVLDLCAAPGGKSTHLLNLLNPDCLLISNEVIRSRTGALVENIQKAGYPNVVVTNNDPSDFGGLPGLFDVVIVDAPCSGEGLFRKDPGAMNEWSERNVELCSARQKRILEAIWPSLRQGGVLVYCTCTYNVHENEENLQWLAQHNDVGFLQIATDENWNVTESKTGNIRGYRLFPHRTTGEGFFLSAVRKLGPEQTTNTREGKNSFPSPSKKISDEIQHWLVPGDHRLIQRNETVQLLPTRYERLIHQLARQLYVLYAGTFVASLKRDKLVPEHSLALSILLNKTFFPSVVLDEEKAIAFLRRETLHLDTAHRGYALASFDNLPLGWMNVLPGRINNMYPSEWRIRM